jgi:hypothetical protein
MSKYNLVVAAIAALVLPAAPAMAQSGTFSSPNSVSKLSIARGGATLGGMRLRAFGAPSQSEMFVGRASLGTSTNRSEGNFTWVNGNNPFTFSYNPLIDTISGSVNGVTRSFANFRSGQDPARQALSMNALEIQFRDVAPGAGTIALTDLMLNGSPTTPFSFLVPETNIWGYLFTPGNLDKGFNFAGNVVLTGVGTFSSNAESNRVEFAVGNAVPEPRVWLLMLAGFGLIGFAARRRQMNAVSA